MTLRQELLQFIWLNQEEEFVPTHIALGQLHERFADDLIPGLIECLTDEDPEVRRIAVELLVEAKANVAVPALIERLNDDDRLVQVAVIGGIGDFGQFASDAIVPLHPWLDAEDEYLRILAATAVMSIDQYRTELLFDIRQALKSENPTVRSVAREFLAKTNASLPFDEAAFLDAVRSHWNYHSLSEQVTWRSMQDEEGIWRCEITPVMQEIFGGEDDGKRVWSGFDFHIMSFAREPGVEFIDYGAASRCEDDAPIPFVGIKGRYFGEPFVLKVGLEPLPDSETREVLDTVRKVVRPIDADGEAAP